MKKALILVALLATFVLASAATAQPVWERYGAVQIATAAIDSVSFADVTGGKNYAASTTGTGLGATATTTLTTVGFIAWAKKPFRYNVTTTSHADPWGYQAIADTSAQSGAVGNNTVKFPVKVVYYGAVSKVNFTPTTSDTIWVRPLLK